MIWIKTSSTIIGYDWEDRPEVSGPIMDTAIEQLFLVVYVAPKIYRPGPLDVRWIWKDKGTRFFLKKMYTVYHNFVYMWYTVHIRRLDKEKVVTDIGELDP